MKNPFRRAVAPEGQPEKPGTPALAAPGPSQSLLGAANQARELSLSLGHQASALENTARNQADKLKDLLVETTALSRSTQDMAGSTDGCLLELEQASQCAEGAKHGFGPLVALMTLVSQGVGQVRAKLAIIADRAEQAQDILAAISRMADQTDLLAVNASIEAEKAGEHGQGFGVLAREIRRLADSASGNGQDMERLVHDLCSVVAAEVMAMDKFTKEIGLAEDELAKAGHGLGELAATLAQARGRFEDWRSRVLSQEQSAQRINQTTQDLWTNPPGLRRLAQSLGDDAAGLAKLGQGLKDLVIMPPPAKTPKKDD